MLFSLRRSLSTSASLNAAIKNVTIVGSGLMGSGIAQVSAQAKFAVTLIDKESAILERALAGVRASVARVAKKQFADDEKQRSKFVDDVLAQLKTSTDLEASVSNADLVVEAIVENVEAKRTLFSQIEDAAKKSTILATNTSSLKLSDIGKNIKNKGSFGGLHFFNPVPVMKLLEVVRHDETSEETFKTLVEFGKAVGKTTVSCKDTPGFIVNRLLVPYMLEALRMYERGDATKEDIDVGMKLGAGYPMGPFELADYVGLDTMQFIQRGWHENYPDEVLFQPSALLNKLVAEGKFGRKTSEGFYKYK